MKGVIPWLVRGASCASMVDFCPALAALVSQVQNIILLTAHFHFMSPDRPEIWASSSAGSPVSVSPVYTPQILH